MSKKLITFVLVLALASISYGERWEGSGINFQGDVCHDGHFLLGNWEMPGSVNGWQATGDYDGWTTISPGVMIGYVANATEGTPLDFYSLKVVAPTGWQKLMELRLPDPQRFGLGNSGLTLEEAFFANDTFEMDILVNPFAGAVEGNGANLQLILNSDGNPAGWGTLGQVDVDPVAGGTYHMSISYAYLFDGDPWNEEFKKWEDPITGDPNYSYLELVLCGWTDVEGDQEWIIDHAVLTPEPTTIALLGLGGLALIRKRR